MERFKISYYKVNSWLNYVKSFIMTNLTRLRLILVDLSGLMKTKKKHLKQNIFFYKSLSLYTLPIWILVSWYANTREQHALPIFTAVSYKKICKNKWVDVM